GELAVAAQRRAELVGRAEAERAVAAHRSRPAGVVVLEERQRLLAVSLGEADVDAGEERVDAGQRDVILLLEAEAVILQVAGGDLAGGARERAGVGLDQAVARVPRPAGGQRP